MADQALEGATAASTAADAVRKGDAYNALRDVYGPGAGAVQNFFAEQAQKAAQTGLTQAQGGEAQANTNYQNALTASEPGKAASTINLQGAQANSANAATDVARQNLAISKRTQDADELLAVSGGDPTKAGAWFDANADRLAADHGLTPEQVPQLRAAIVADPAAFAMRVKSQNPESGIGIGDNGPEYTVTNPNVGVPQPAPPGSVRPFAAPEGAPINFVDEQGHPRIVTMTKFGQATEGGRALSPDDMRGWKKTTELGTIPAQQNANTASDAEQLRRYISMPAGAEKVALAKTLGIIEGKKIGADLPLSTVEYNAAQATNQADNENYDRLDKIAASLGKDAGALTTGLGSALTGWAPGSPARAFEDQLQTLRSAAAIQTAQATRTAKSGAPIAVRNLQEFKAYQDFLSHIDPHASASVVRAQVQQFRGALAQRRAATNAQFKAITSTTPAAQPTSGVIQYDATGKRVQ